MKSFLAAGFAVASLYCVTLQASMIPILHLDKATLKAFEDYVAEFEKTDVAPFTAAGKMWIDGVCCGRHSAFDAGKPVVEPRRNEDVANGSIHHTTVMIRVPGGTIDAMRSVMKDYTNYPRYFPPDVISGSGEPMPDSTPEDEHFHTSLLMSDSTVWLKVGFRTQYDTHYLRLDPNRWEARSLSSSIKELTDPANPGGGTFNEGDDHGFLWKTDTFWFVRQRDGGIDIELNSISLSRPAPTGFGWYATKRARDAAEKMTRDMKTAIARAGK